MTITERQHMERLIEMGTQLPPFELRWLKDRERAGVTLAVLERERLDKLAAKYLEANP